MQARWEKGLCYNCDEKLSPRHQCKTQQVYMLEMGIEGVEDDLQYEKTARDEAIVPPKILLHALLEVSTPQTMRVVGSIDGRKLHILIDSGSTHNFVNARFAAKLGCCKVPARGFRVTVANNEVLVCKAT